METKQRLTQITIRVCVERKVKVRAHIRLRNGRHEKVKCHYRRLRVI